MTLESAVETMTVGQLLERIAARVEAPGPAKAYGDDFLWRSAPVEPAFALIVGAGFSAGAVPTTRELMHETIGVYDEPDSDGSAEDRPVSGRRSASRRFWRAYNDAARGHALPCIELNKDGLPIDVTGAYQSLFKYDVAELLYSETEDVPSKYLRQMIERRDAKGQPAAMERRPAAGAPAGRRFVTSFLEYVLDPSRGRSGSTGRSELNPAHIYLGALLEAQQIGWACTQTPFCRTVLTTNFDALLQNALQLFNLVYCLSDRPDKGFDAHDFPAVEAALHLVYAHGTVHRGNAASTVLELSELKERNADALRAYLSRRDLLVIGYGGWDDAIMRALWRCQETDRAIYWCDTRPAPTPHVQALLEQRPGGAYVHLGPSGATGLMQALYEFLTPEPRRHDVWQRYRAWTALKRTQPAPPRT
jgi:hypothetical protein